MLNWEIPYKTFIDNLGGSIQVYEKVDRYSYTLMGCFGHPISVFKWLDSNVIDNIGKPILYKNKPIKSKDAYNIINEYEKSYIRIKKLGRILYENQER
jgi:hypothetical protein